MSQNNGVDVTEYLLDIQPSLAVVLKSKIGSQNTHYVHGLRGIASQQSGAGWSDAIADGLGSVRGWLNGSQTFVSDVNYNPYGVPDASVDGFGFTGEMTDDNGLVYLRARYYDPNAGVFASLDPFEGVHNRPMSVNGYSWVEGNVANWVDPSGMTIINIWAAAFIMPESIPFVYSSLRNLTGTTLPAIWHGDGRSWHTLDDFDYDTPLSSRVWFNLRIDTESTLVLSEANTGITIATIQQFYLQQPGSTIIIPTLPQFQSRDIMGHAPRPESPHISWNPSHNCNSVNSTLTVSISEESHNPLIEISPPIVIDDVITFDFTIGWLSVKSRRSVFPWHELHIAIDGQEPIAPIYIEPSGPTFSPLDLGLSYLGQFHNKEVIGTFTPQSCKDISNHGKAFDLLHQLTNQKC